MVGCGGNSTVVQIRVHPSEQHFFVPSQSESNKHVSEPSVGGHSDLAAAFSTGQRPGLFDASMSPRKEEN